MFQVMVTSACFFVMLSTSSALAVGLDAPANELASSYDAVPSPAPSTTTTTTKTADDQNKQAEPSQQAKANKPTVVLQKQGPNIEPRMEFSVGSVAKLISEAKRSHAGPFVEFIRRLAIGMSQRSSEGVDAEAVTWLFSQVTDWPDTSVEAVTFAPDLLGRSRWAIRVHWPIADVYERMHLLLSSEVGQDLFEGVAVESREAGGYKAVLLDEPIAYLLPQGADDAIIASHDDLIFPKSLFAGVATDEENPSYLLTARLNLADTERDSGATFFSSLHMLKSVDYAAFVDDGGTWQENVRVNWPPIVGIGAKAMMGKVRKTFFVPQEAFGAVVVSSLTFPSMLENMAGFGPQVFMEQSGQFEIAQVDGESEFVLGPMASRASDDICVTLLPGTGFLPAPDTIIQTRMTDADTFESDVRKMVTSINKLFRERDQKEPWREIEVRSKPVFYRDATNVMGPMFMPLVMRPVIFSHREADAKGKERDYLILAWTSTSPEALVRRWLDFPRRLASLFLPKTRKRHGQVWLNWKQVYKWVTPYINTALSSASTDVILPSVSELGDRLADAWLTGKISYNGLYITHAGPLPLGAFVVPSMLATSMAMDQSQSSDLARERIASQRLKVLYHHAKLFRKDIGRWPAEVAELDGYVDFAGHPELLHMRVSSKRAWSQLFGDMFPESDDDKADADEDKDDEDELEDESTAINDDLYVIDWGSKRWTLGYATGTFDHLEKLYVDQDGVIVRVALSPTDKSDEGEESPNDAKADNDTGKEDKPVASPPVTSTEQPAR